MNNFGVIKETVEKILKASTLATTILSVLERDHRDFFYISGNPEYTFIDKDTDKEITGKLSGVTVIGDMVEYEQFVKLSTKRMILTFPILEEHNYNPTNISQLVIDYTIIVGLLKKVITDKKTFTVINMNYMNAVNRNISQFIYGDS